MVGPDSVTRISSLTSDSRSLTLRASSLVSFSSSLLPPNYGTIVAVNE